MLFELYHSLICPRKATYQEYAHGGIHVAAASHSHFVHAELRAVQLVKYRHAFMTRFFLTLPLASLLCAPAFSKISRRSYSRSFVSHFLPTLPAPP